MADFNLGRVVGDKGDKGDKGEQGVQGTQGVAGRDGTSVTIMDGIFSPENPLPLFADTNEGEAYVFLHTLTEQELTAQLDTRIGHNQRYDLYIHASGGADWLILHDWGGVPGQDSDMISDIGDIKTTARNIETADGKWLQCDGRELSKAEYAELYGVVGDAFVSTQLTQATYKKIDINPPTDDSNNVSYAAPTKFFNGKWYGFQVKFDKTGLLFITSTSSWQTLSDIQYTDIEIDSEKSYNGITALIAGDKVVLVLAVNGKNEQDIFVSSDLANWTLVHTTVDNVNFNSRYSVHYFEKTNEFGIFQFGNNAKTYFWIYTTDFATFQTKELTGTFGDSAGTIGIFNHFYSNNFKGIYGVVQNSISGWYAYKFNSIDDIEMLQLSYIPASVSGISCDWIAEFDNVFYIVFADGNRLYYGQSKKFNFNIGYIDATVTTSSKKYYTSYMQKRIFAQVTISGATRYVSFGRGGIKEEIQNYALIAVGDSGASGGSYLDREVLIVEKTDGTYALNTTSDFQASSGYVRMPFIPTLVSPNTFNLPQLSDLDFIRAK
ncbi:MAG: tail fiber protein [Firmicutes bacterium]|nr:tail fiber protein [Bacillota bacterium]